MKKIILLFIILSSVYCSADDLWQRSEGGKVPGYIRQVKISKNDELAVKVNSNVLFSADTGRSWTQVNLPSEIFNSVWVTDIEFDNDNNLLILTSTGLFRKKLGMETIDQIFSIPGYFPYLNDNSLVVSENVYIISDLYNIWVSYDKGKNWKHISIDLGENFRESVTYSNKYGIMFNYYFQDFFPGRVPNTIYTTDEGLSWKVMKTIPGTNYSASEVEVLDENYWVVNYGLFDFQNGNFNYINTPSENFWIKKGKQRFYSCSYSSVYYSDDNCQSWKMLKDTVFDSKTLIHSFDANLKDDYCVAGNNGNIGIYLSSTDKWYFRKVFSTPEKSKMLSKIAGKHVYFYNGYNDILHSENYGVSWELIEPDSINPYGNQSFDGNSKGEMIYLTSNTIHFYTPVNSSWEKLGGSFFSDWRIQYCQILDNGQIFGVTYSSKQNDYKNFIIENVDSAPKWLQDNVIKSIVKQLPNGDYFCGTSISRYAIVDSNFVIKRELDTLFKTFGDYSYDDVIAVTDNDIYFATNSGLYKSAGMKDTFKLLCSEYGIRNLFVDDSNRIYFTHDLYQNMTDYNIYMSRNQGRDWVILNDNLGTGPVENFNVSPSGNAILRSDYFYTSDLQNKKFLSIQDSLMGQVIVRGRDNKYFCTVKDEWGQPVDSAKVIVFNSLDTSKTDTILTDANGNAVYKINFDYTNVVESNNLYICSKAVKEGYVTGRSKTKREVYYLLYNDSLYAAGQSFNLVKIDSTIYINISLRRKANNNYGYDLLPGKMIIRNELFQKSDTIDFDGKDDYKYQITIPNDAELGFYKLSLKGFDVTGDRTFTHEMYLQVTDTIRFNNVAGDNNKMTNAILVYPDPVGDYLSISIENQLKVLYLENIEIYSAMGGLVQGAGYSDKINVTGLAPGMYFVRIGNMLGKFVKK